MECVVGYVNDFDKSIFECVINCVVIIGVGIMGGGIVMNFVNVGILVMLLELKEEVFEKGFVLICKNYENLVKKGKLI